MKILEDRIRKDGIITENEIVKVDSFINHQVDPVLYDQMADEFIAHFKDKKINKVVTIESSGIAMALAVARKLNVPFVFAKKTESVNLHGDVYSAKIISYTHFREYDVIVSKKFLNEDDHVLILDDFLANGSALRGLLSICKQAGAKVSGIGIIIEKTWQRGGKELRAQGYEIESLAKIKNITENEVEFD